MEDGFGLEVVLGAREEDVDETVEELEDVVTTDELDDDDDDVDVATVVETIVDVDLASAVVTVEVDAAASLVVLVVGSGMTTFVSVVARATSLLMTSAWVAVARRVPRNAIRSSLGSIVDE